MGLQESAGVEAELARLRLLVGSSEKDYADLRADADGARAAARESEAQLGELRGTIVELHVELDRLRQQQMHPPHSPAASFPSVVGAAARRVLRAARTRFAGRR